MSVRKTIVVVFAVLLLVSTVSAEVPTISVGGFGGLSIPVIQEDQANGTEFGVRARMPLMSVFVVEASFSLAQWGDPGTVQGINLGISGSKLTSYGLGVTIGHTPGKSGFKPFALISGGMYKVTNDDTGYDESKLGFSTGLGVAYGISPSLDIDVRGLAVFAPQEDGSKKAVSLTFGLNYTFGSEL